MSNGNKTGFVGTIKSSFHDIVATGGFITEPSTKMVNKATRGVTFCERNTGMNENGSINRTISNDDDDSDIDDVPEVTTPAGAASTKQGGLLAIAKNSDVAAFFESMQYRTVSLLCGPMACFFFISYVVSDCHMLLHSVFIWFDSQKFIALLLSLILNIRM